MLDRINKKLSKKILDFCENLPEFQGGRIATIQRHRRSQKKFAETARSKAIKPNDAELSFESIQVVLFFDHKNFSKLRKGVGGYFKNSDWVRKFLNSHLETEDALTGLSWHNLGGVVTDSRTRISPHDVIDNDLPNMVDYVSVSHSQILPSISVIGFSFKINKEMTHKIKATQNKLILGSHVYEEIWNLKKFPYVRSSMQMPDHARELEVNDLKRKMSVDIERWIMDRFKWKPDDIREQTCVETYYLSGKNLENDEVRKHWIQQNRAWLDDWGINTRIHDKKINSEFMVCIHKAENNLDNLVAAAVYFSGNENPDDFEEGFLFHTIPSVAISLGLARLSKHVSREVESLRADGLRQIYKRKAEVIKNPRHLIQIKHKLIEINRLLQDLEVHEQMLVNEYLDIGDMQSGFAHKEINPAKSWYKISKDTLVSSKSFLILLDSSLTELLSIESLHVMYSMQRKMFYLSVIVLFATVVGVIATLVSVIDNWPTIEPFLQGLWFTLKDLPLFSG